MARSNFEFADRVARELRRSTFDFAIEPAIEGVRPDFVVTLPGGQSVVVEAKAWNATPVNLARAEREVQFYRDRFENSEAVVVVPELLARSETESVIALDRLADWLAERATTATGGTPIPTKPGVPIMFCAMPFDGEFDDVYFFAMNGAAEDNGLSALRIDEDEFNGNIVERIVDRIEESAVVVVDLSRSRPNVMYEFGYASALSKPIVPICSTPLDEMPFDVAQLNTIAYSPGRTFELIPRLSKRVGIALAGE